MSSAEASSSRSPQEGDSHTAAAAPLAPQVAPHVPTNAAPLTTFSSFSHLLDARLLRSLASLGFAHPTPVQSSVVPLALGGRDILARARTGSGKTLAYGIPIVQKIVEAKKNVAKSSPSYQATRALILVPTRELSQQVTVHIGALLDHLEEGEVRIANVSRDASKSVQKLVFSERPDIVVATPSKALAYLQSSSLDLSALQVLSIDEADLILSYGYDDDVRALLAGGYLPKTYQSFLMSATMSKDVNTLKGLMLRKPAILHLKDAAASSALSQYVVHVKSQVDKFLLIYVILRLRLVRGKCIIFVNDVDRCYKVRLFLEQFGVKSCVLNEELPANSRYHIVQEFNKGVYDYIIATDESRFGADAMDDEEEEEEAEAQQGGQNQDGVTLEEEEDEEDEADEGVPTGAKRKRSASPTSESAKDNVAEAIEDEAPSKKKRNGKDKARSGGPSSSGDNKEYGVSRGIDFVAVACVINFDLPVSARGYTHRVGRTARAGNTGTALSFVVPQEVWEKDLTSSSGSKKFGIVCPTSQHDEGVWERVERQERARGSGEIKEWRFDRKQVEGFRYRMEDALRAVTRSAIKEARIKEIKQEILNSEKLKAHFEDNPHDLAYLRHDVALHPTRVQPHMKHVPSYLMPRIGGIRQPPSRLPGAGADGKVSYDENGRSLGYVGFRRGGARGGRDGRGGRGGRGGARGGRGGSKAGSAKKNDPLRKFKT